MGEESNCNGMKTYVNNCINILKMWTIDVIILDLDGALRMKVK